MITSKDQKFSDSTALQRLVKRRKERTSLVNQNNNMVERDGKDDVR